MDACGSTRRGKAGKCDARLTKLFADIAPEDASASRISGGKSHAQRLDDVFGSLNHTLSGADAPAPPTLASLEAPAPAPSRAIATTSKEAAKKSKRAAPAAAQTGIHDRNLGPAVVRRRGARGRDVLPARAEERKGGGGEAPADADVPDDAAPRFPEAAAARGRRRAAEASRRVALAPRR